MGDINITIDTSQLEAALVDYEVATGRDMADILNRAGRNVAFQAIRNTPKADKSKIDQLREQVATQIRGKKRLLKHPKAIYAATDRAKLIYLHRMRKAGKDPRAVFASAAELDAAVLKMVNARLAAIGFLKAGYFPAAKKFAEATGTSWSGGSVKGQPKGTATIAKESDRDPFALLTNDIFAESATGGSALERYGTEALQQAVNDVAADMQSYAERKLEETARKFSGT